MERRSFYFKQKVTHQELNAAFDGAEQAIWNLLVDLGLTGIVSNMAATQHGTPNLSVDVSGNAVAYDPSGKRIAIATLQNVDLSHDSNAVSTSVASGGNSKIVSLFAKYKQVLSDPRTDGNSATVYFVAAEGFEFHIVQSAESASPTPPSLDPTMLLLADITLTHSQTTIVNGNISTARRQDAIVLSGSPASVRRGKLIDALTDVLTAFNSHVNGTSNLHPAVAVSYAGGGTWADSATNPATTVEAQLDKIISDLAGTTGGGGIQKIGAPAVAGTRFGLTLGTVGTQMTATKIAIDGMKTNGVDTALTYASIAALRAVVSSAIPTNGIACVAGYALWMWSPSSTATDDGLFVVRPSDNPTNGRWLSLQQQKGIRVVDLQSLILSTSGGVIQSSSSGSIVDVTGATVSCTVQAGDRVVLVASFTADTTSASTKHFALSVVDGSTIDVMAIDTLVATSTVATTSIALSGVYTAANTGTLVAKIRANPNGTNLTIYGQLSLFAVVIR